MDKSPDCLLLHGWGVSNTIWQEFEGHLKGFNNVTNPCLYEIAKSTEDNRIESVATKLSSTINLDTVIIAWSIAGLIATRLSKLTDKVKAVIFISSTPCFVNKEKWPYVIDKNNIDNLQNKLSTNTDNALNYFAGLIAQGDTSIKSTNRFIRNNLADEKHKRVLSWWLVQMQQIDQRKEFAELNVPAQIILGENDSLINPKLQNQIKKLNSNIHCVVMKDCGHAPFISKQKETIKIIDEFIRAKLN